MPITRAPRPALRPFRFNISPRSVALLMVVSAAALALPGCMRMQTQRTTLEHQPRVVAPEGDAVATAPIETTEPR